MTDAAAPHRAPAALAFLLALVLLGMGAWQRPLFDADEGRYASVAVNMVERGDWVVPHLNDMPFMDKPPLVYWVQAVAFELTGRSELGARLPTLLGGALVALFVFLFTLDVTGRRRAAWLAAAAWSTGAAGMIGSRVGPQMDMPLCACVSGAMYAAWCLVRRPGRTASVGLGVAVGCGLLVKGPLVVAVPGLVGIAWVLCGVDVRRVLRVAFSPWAWGVALVIAAPWYVLVERAMPGWIQHFIEYEHFGRFTRGDHRSFHPFWYYVPIALIYLAPWTPLAWGGRRGPLAFLTASPWSPVPWRARLEGTVPIGTAGREVRSAQLLWVWFLAAFLLYSTATRKLLNYLLPAAPPLFVLVGASWDHLLAKRQRRVLALPLLVALGAGALAACVAAGWWFPLRTGTLPTAIEQPRWAPLAPWMGAAAGLLALGVVFARAERNAKRSAALLLAFVAAGWWTFDWGFAKVGDLGSSRGIVTALVDDVMREDPELVVAAPLVALKRYPQGSGLLPGGRRCGSPADRRVIGGSARS